MSDESESDTGQHPEHTVEYDAPTVTMSDGSERPALGRDVERDVSTRVDAIEAYLLETRRVADSAYADVKDETTSRTLQDRVRELEQRIAELEGDGQ